MGNQGRSEPSIWGGYDHYDKNGKKIGHSDPGIFGGYDHYDANGKKVGHSDPGIFGGYDNYDANGKKIGHSDPGIFGGYDHYDAKGKKVGSSDPGVFGGYSNSSSSGSGACYIATCVYGSYDCPSVWTLRRFRDHFLAASWIGRIVIRVYYAISPYLVRSIGTLKITRIIWKWQLDPFVRSLNRNGYSDQPYKD